MGLSSSEDRRFSSFDMIPDCVGRTDGRTVSIIAILSNTALYRASYADTL